MTAFSWTAGDVSGGTALVDAPPPTGDHIYASHINELRSAADTLNTAIGTVSTAITSIVRAPFKVISQAGDGDYNCDGTADDVQIQAALTAANVAGGATIFIKKGTYDITAKLTIYSNTHLVGEGIENTILKAGTNCPDRMIVNSKRDVGSGFDYNFSLRNMTFDGNGSNQTGPTPYVTPTFSRLDGFKVLECRFKNFRDTLFMITGDTFLRNYNVTIRDCEFIGTGQTDGYDLVDVGNGSNHLIERCYFYDGKNTGQTFLSLAESNFVTVRDCKIDGNSNAGGLTSYLVNGLTIDNNEITNINYHGIRIVNWHSGFDEVDSVSTKIINNNIHGCSTYGIWFAQTYNSTILYSRAVNVSGNSIYNCQKDGIKTEGYNKYVISDNHIFNNSLEGAGTYYAINLDWIDSYTLNDPIITTNNIFDTQGTATQTRGIRLSHTDYARLLGNSVQNCGTLALVQASDTNTKALFNLNITDI